MDLPKWAQRLTKEGKKVPIIRVDANLAYPSMLAELKTAKADESMVDENKKSILDKLDPEKPDVYWLEVAFQCIKMEIQLIEGFSIEIHIKDPEKKWNQKKFPKGRGWFAATKGKEARNHFRRLRGRLP